MKKFMAAIATASMVASFAIAASGTAAAGTPEFVPAPVAWGNCEDPRLQRRGAECGFVEVPLDYGNPGGTKIKLAVSRIKHKVAEENYQGVVLVNPGGPGGSGLLYSIFSELVPNGVGGSYDWIGFDPRGVGSSQPSLSCGERAAYNRPYYVPVTPELEQTWLKRSKDYADKCAAAQPELLKHMKTTDWVNDMESIRKALGQKQINFVGFSFGSYLGQAYSTLHPDKMRRMVLDGNVDPRRVWYDANLDQDIAFDRNIKIFFDWVAKYDSVYHLGTSGADIEKLYYEKVAELRKNPAGGVVGPDEFNDIFVQAGYYVFGWKDVASAFSAFVNNGDFQPLKKLFDGGNPQEPGADNSYAVYLAVQCTDAQWPKSWNTWRIDNWYTHAKAPFQTWGNAWFNAPCLYWGAKAGKPVKVDGSKVASALLISETYDAATPFAGSLEVRSRYPNSSLIEGVGGSTHSGSFKGGKCIDGAIADYLATGKRPDRKPGRKSDLTCDPNPQPDPTAPEARSAAPAVPLGLSSIR